MDCHVWYVFIIVLLCPVRTDAQTPAVQVSGFGDVYYKAPIDSAETPFSLGQAEVDLHAGIKKNISISTALAINGETGSFGLGEFFVDFLLFGVEENHLRPVRGITHSGIIAGQFDVPFGIDWEQYASIDRKLVTTPLVVEKAHNLWNDTGVQIYFSNNRIKGVVYSVNGFGYDDIEIRYATGGRMAVKPVPILEIGGSYAGFVRPGGDRDISLFGGDICLDWRDLLLKGEYITRKTGLADNTETTSFGYYIEGLYRMDRLFSVARHDSYDSFNAEKMSRSSFGGGLIVTDGCELRFEYQFRPDEEDDVTFLQLAAGF